MANPAIVSCADGVWTLVASNVTSGSIKKMDSKPNLYLETYRTTGDPAPTGLAEGFPIEGRFAEISASAGIDVYIMAIGNDGSVRVDV